MRILFIIVALTGFFSSPSFAEVGVLLELNGEPVTHVNIPSDAPHHYLSCNMDGIAWENKYVAWSMHYRYHRIK